MLRYVDHGEATIWVETDRACVVTIDAGPLSASSATWAVHGHHYALLQLSGLGEGTVTPYEVRLDDALVWPEPDSPYPPSVIRTLTPASSLRLVFGSCRRWAPYDEAGLEEYGADALAALAERMRHTDYEAWPDALFMAGDQIYADEPSPALVARLHAAHTPTPPGREEVVDEVWSFEEYTWLYHETWSPPPVRWLLSTVPTCMLLDDHDLRDDWNTSLAWREEVTSQAWWRDRVVGAFGSYWVYQHLGNLSPEQLGSDALFEQVRGLDDDAQRTELLDDFAWRADAEKDTARWSFVRDYGTGEGRVRLVAMECRASRQLGAGRRRMIDDHEWDWIIEQATSEPVAHLLLGSTLPVLLPRGIHQVEGWNEALTSGRYGSLVTRWGERLRQVVDLEHWAAFRDSFARLVELLRGVVTESEPPSSVLILSGDVHCSYTARARIADTPHPRTQIVQLTMSPFRNYLPVPVKLVNRTFEKAPFRVGLRGLARAFRVADTGLDWELTSGPWFRNGLMTVVLAGRTARLEVDVARHSGREQYLEYVGDQVLTMGPPTSGGASDGGSAPAGGGVRTPRTSPALPSH